MALAKKYKGSTLPEVLIALAITSFCSTLAVIIYVNIQKSSLPFIRMKSNELAAKYLNEALDKKDYFDNAYHEEEFTIKKKAVRNAIFQDCMDITVSVYNVEGKKLTTLQTSIYGQ